ncbi:hypothetical protein N7526_000009 [Penicillium atrosanguineum]|nr:hypothetical protein N7526_000009 [Penicillium atrosanguineum]
MISAIPVENQTIDDDHGKAHALLEAFFPPLPSILDGPHEEVQQLAPLHMETINAHETEAALLKMASWKAPGPDGLLVVVWQRIWPLVKHWVVEIFQASLCFSYFPANYAVLACDKYLGNFNIQKEKSRTGHEKGVQLTGVDYSTRYSSLVVNINP